MQLRNDRRRRVLSDELLAADMTADTANGPLVAATGLRYAPAANPENQPRLTDFIPLRALPFALLFGLALVLIASLLLAYTWLPELARYVPREALATLDLAERHHAGTWLASLLLLANMQLALLVYSLRRHRVDDYHGRYRIWLAVAAMSLLATLDLTAGTHHLVRVALAPAARWCGVAEDLGFWAVAGALGLYLTVRLLLETRRARLAVTCLIAALAAFATPLVMQSGWLRLPMAEIQTLITAGSQLVGCLLLVSGTTLFARHVLLDVEGKLPERKPRPAKPPKAKKAKAPKAAKAGTAETTKSQSTKGKIHVDPPQKPKPHGNMRTDLDAPVEEPAPAAAAKAAAASKPTARPVAELEDGDDDNDDSTDLRHLSRAERKRVKREAKLARRAELAR